MATGLTLPPTVLASVHPFVVVFGAGVVLVGQSYSSDSGAGGASGMCAGGVCAVLVVLAGRLYLLAVAHVVVCVLEAFALCWRCWQVGCTRWRWRMWWRVLAAFALCWQVGHTRQRWRWCWRVCWQCLRCAGGVGRLVVLVGSGACGGVCWQHSCCAGGSVVLVGGGSGAGVCAGGICANAGGVGVGLDTRIS